MQDIQAHPIPENAYKGTLLGDTVESTQTHRAGIAANGLGIFNLIKSYTILYMYNGILSQQVQT